jgi:hypothetical protein
MKSTPRGNRPWTVPSQLGHQPAQGEVPIADSLIA